MQSCLFCGITIANVSEQVALSNGNLFNHMEYAKYNTVAHKLHTAAFGDNNQTHRQICMFGTLCA